LSHTSTPFESVRTVTPISGISRRELTVPGAGALASSARPAISSRHGVTVALSPSRSASRNIGSVTAVSPGFSGADAMTTRSFSVIISRASVASSVVVNVARNFRARSTSITMPGAASALR
jgi:hypothetical protein